MRIAPYSSIFIRAFFALSLLLPSFAEARIGESRSQLERRLLRESGKGLLVKDDDLEDFHRERFDAYGAVLALEDENWEHVLYFKINETVIPSSARLWIKNDAGRRSEKPNPRPDGWLLHVIYLNGVSVLETYVRSSALTEIETNGILEINSGGSQWMKGAPPEEDGVIQPTVFPANIYTKDFGVYGEMKGNEILLYDPRLDEMIHAARLEKAEEEAPMSLHGF
ncbi:MAG: hypothetical protein AAGJ81_15550 [Verrucomicrobiota bacterium]